MKLIEKMHFEHQHLTKMILGTDSEFLLKLSKINESENYTQRTMD